MPRRFQIQHATRLLGLMLVVMSLAASAQWGGGRQGGRGTRTYSRGSIPTWEYDRRFEHDLFRFTRAAFNGGRGWQTDYPNAELNFSWRLTQITSLKVNPDPHHLDLLDPELANNPIIFMVDPRSLRLSDMEATALRNYLLNGGFLMVDDFWGNRMLRDFQDEMERVFPDIQPVSLAHDHEIFKIVFPLTGPPQVPSEDSARRTSNMQDPYRTWEDEIGWEQPQPADYKAYFDENGRMMVLVCWNTDLTDGWEEEGVSEWFFENFAEKYSYPMGVNILFYVMTH